LFIQYSKYSNIIKAWLLLIFSVSGGFGMDNMSNDNNVDNMNKTESMEFSNFGSAENESSNTDTYEQAVQDYEPQKNGFINIQSIPVKRHRLKKILPFALAVLVAALLGGAAGGAYVNYLIGRNAYISPITSSTSQGSPIKTTNYSTSNSLIAKIAEEDGPTVVGISTKGVSQGFFGDKKVSVGTGSGIIFDKKGLIVTNQHVIDGGNDITVTLPGGKPLKAQIIGSDPSSDIAVLKINADNLPTAIFGDSSKLRVGDLAVAIGNPMGEEYAGTVTSGIISALNRTMNVEDGEYNRRYKLIQTDAAINPGNSGGALINENGEVIGINTIKYVGDKVEGMGFAIPINEVKTIVDQLLKNGYVSRPQLGVGVITITEDMAKEYKSQIGAGIETVTKGSSAEAAGLKPKDIITSIDEVKVISSDDLINELEKHKVGDQVKVTIWRDGQIQTLPVTLGEMNKKTS
jgi:serine protease Do